MKLTKQTSLFRLFQNPPTSRRTEQTVAGELLLESGDAFLLESSPDDAGNLEFIRLEA